MSEYSEVIAQYETGLITKAEANARIDLINMGSDSKTFDRIR